MLSSIQVTPLPFVTVIDVVVFTMSLMPWDTSQYALYLAHIEACAILLWNATNMFRELPQSSATVEQLHELEVQNSELRSQMDEA